MNGADRFQLFFDSIARKTTGCGNVIRALIKVNGIIPEDRFREMIRSNEAIRFLASAYPERKWYSTVNQWKFKNDIETDSILKIYSTKDIQQEIQNALVKDCLLKPGLSIRIDVFYSENNQTTILISVNHALIDYAGMENLIASISGLKQNLTLQKSLNQTKSFLKKFTDAIAATVYVASRTSWNMRRLKKQNKNHKPCLLVTEFSKEESLSIKNHLVEVQSTALPFLVAASTYTLWKHSDLLTDKSGDFFMAVPLDRRPADFKDVLFANYLSFVYFHKTDDGITDIKKLTKSFNTQMIEQARKKLPEKFMSLLELFRFLPPVIYRLWMNLPSKGHSASFAFSLLNNSILENNSFMGYDVIDVTHYPPVISPPGLTLVFTEFREKLKIITSFDSFRITHEQVNDFINDLRKNLLN